VLQVKSKEIFITSFAFLICRY